VKIFNNLRKKEKGLVADFFWGEVLQLANKIKGSCDLQGRVEGRVQTL
jgi:hypothetical protein